MTFEDLQKANELIKATDIGRGKSYAEVNQRIKAFRFLYPNGSIQTDLVSNDGGVCVFKATVRDDDGCILGTGTAYEKEDANFINKTSYIENCETSAVGRALAMCGLGIDVSIASKEEVENAILNQQKMSDDLIADAELRTKVIGYVNRHKMSKENIKKICDKYGVAALTELSTDNCKDYIAKLEKNGGNIDE